MRLVDAVESEGEVIDYSNKTPQEAAEAIQIDCERFAMLSPPPASTSTNGGGGIWLIR